MFSTKDYMFAKVANFQVDVETLRKHFHETVTKFPFTNYKDNRVDYVGWAVTSRDGSLSDGVRRISTKPKPGEVANNKRGVMRTPICTGALADAMDQLQASGFRPYRVRLMALKNEGEAMAFHTDAKAETWRLHIPLITNPHCFFEWRRPDGKIESVHLPADGSAWLVRVDIDHRAVNFSGLPSERVHLLMGLNELPKLENLGEPHILV